MTRYFPEVADAVRASLPPRCVLDGEIVVAAPTAGRSTSGRCSSACTRRPAGSRLLAERTPAAFIAFDLLALGDEDYMPRPFRERRAALERALAAARAARPPHADHARRGGRPALVRAFEGAGPRRRDREGRRCALPARQARDGEDQARADRRLRARRLPRAQVRPGRDRLAAARPLRRRRHAGVAVGGHVRRAALGRRRRRVRRWRAGASCSPSCSRSSATSPTTRGDRIAGRRSEQARGREGSRWNPGKDLSFVPLRPERVLEVRYDHMEGARFRHPPQFVRWRPDREPASCGYAQLERPGPVRARGRAGRTRDLTGTGFAPIRTARDQLCCTNRFTVLASPPPAPPRRLSPPATLIHSDSNRGHTA